MTRTLTIPEQHQLRIARETVKHPMKALLGPPSVEEAKEIIAKLTGQRPAKDSRRARLHRALDAVMDRRAARDVDKLELEFNSKPGTRYPIKADTMREAKRCARLAGLNPNGDLLYKIYANGIRVYHALDAVMDKKPDGTVSPDEEVREQDLLAEVSQTVQKWKKTANDIGGSFRSPGILARVKQVCIRSL